METQNPKQKSQNYPEKISLKFNGAGKLKSKSFWFFAVVFCFLFLVFGFDIAHAATLYFSPSSGSHAIGTTLSVSVYISSADQATNAASGVIVFPQDKLEVASLAKNGSIFNLWVQEPSFSNSAGTVNFEGIVLNPGFTGSSGKVITITFKAKAAGNASLTFYSGSILANDGKGTNILTGMGDANFTVGAVGQGSLVPESPIIISATHPDENQWYSNKSLQFSWVLPSGVTAVRLLYDKNPASVPTVIYSPAISEKKLEDLPDGVYYLHARFKNNYGWGEIAHRKILIDTVAPEPFELTIDNGGDSTNPAPAVNFETKDELSGIKEYEINIDGLKNIVLPLSPLAPGKHTIEVRAFDKAGNFASASREFEIIAIEAPKISRIPILKIGKIAIDYLTTMVTLIILLIGAGVVIFYAWYRISLWRKRLRKETGEVKKNVSRAFRALREEVEEQIEFLDGKPGLNKDERKVRDKLKEALGISEDFIGKEIKDVEKELE